MLDGRKKWNDATDTTSNPGTTNRPPYYFSENQSGGIPSADVVIIRDPAVSYAGTDATGHPRYMRINPTWAATLTRDELAAAIAHELGHPHGVGNTYVSGSGCENATSIMQGLNLSLKPTVKNVQQRDVYQMNKAASNPGDCCADVNAPNTLGTASPTPTPPCPDNDGDGLTTCDGDCDDTDPFIRECPGRCIREECPPGSRWWSELCECRFGDACPVLLDISGNGFDLTDVARGVAFDLNSDGLANV